MRIDWWTLALQTVNVLILIWLLARFFFRPVMDIVAKRQDEARTLLTDAQHARQEAADARAEADQMREKIASGREQVMAQAREAAQTEKQKLLAQLSGELAKRRGEADAAIAHDRAAAEAAIIDRAGELAVEIAQRLLSRLPQRDNLSAFLDEICGALRQLSPEARESLVSGATADHPIEIVTAAPLSGAQSEQVRAALKTALGTELPLAFRSDAAIIDGVELKGQTTIIRNSWSAILDRIRRELTDDAHAHRP